MQGEGGDVGGYSSEFNALFGDSLAYKPFHNRLAKRGFAEFMRACTERLLERLVLKVLQVKRGQAFSEFRRIVIQDGSSFAVQDSLHDVFPGRFSRVIPAAVEWHVSLDLLSESVEHVTLTPDTFGSMRSSMVALLVLVGQSTRRSNFLRLTPAARIQSGTVKQDDYNWAGGTFSTWLKYLRMMTG